MTMAAAADGKNVNDHRLQDDSIDCSPSHPPHLIQPIPPQAIQRIVAGQAITDLSSAVKELVDNAIDAGARRVMSEFSCVATGSMFSVRIIVLKILISQTLQSSCTIGGLRQSKFLTMAKAYRPTPDRTWP